MVPPHNFHSPLHDPHTPTGSFQFLALALVKLDKQGNCDRVRVGITGLGPKPFRPKAVESALQGKAPAQALGAAAAHAAEGIDVLSDLHASAEFRAELARVYTRRALETAVGRAQP